MNFRSQKIYELGKQYRVNREKGKQISKDHWLKECFRFNDKLVYCRHGGRLDEKLIIILPSQDVTEGYIEVSNEQTNAKCRLVYFHPIKRCLVQEELGEKNKLLKKLFIEHGMKKGKEVSFCGGTIGIEESNCLLNKLYLIDSDDIKHIISDKVVSSIKVDENNLFYQRMADIYGEEEWRFTGITVSMNGVSSSVYKVDIEIDDGKVIYLFKDENNDKKILILKEDFSVNLISKKEGDLNFLYLMEILKNDKE